MEFKNLKLIAIQHNGIINAPSNKLALEKTNLTVLMETLNTESRMQLIQYPQWLVRYHFDQGNLQLNV